MNVSYGPFRQHDRRIKLLWIEDNPDQMLPQDMELADWTQIFAIDGCVSPEEVCTLLPDGHTAVERGRHSQVYD